MIIGALLIVDSSGVLNVGGKARKSERNSRGAGHFQGSDDSCEQHEHGFRRELDCVSGYKRVLHHECASPQAELQRFERAVTFAGRFAHIMHQNVGAPIRGVQGAHQRITNPK